jgi:glucosamine-6-phosphate deaminase
VLLCSGHSKEADLKHAVELVVNHICYMSALQLHNKSMILCDEGAIGELKYNTVKYFKDIE